MKEPDGTLKQRRYYGPDGRAEKDIDYTDHGNIPMYRINMNGITLNPIHDKEMNQLDINEFLNCLNIGHEIEFCYNGNKYSFSQCRDGWCLTKYKDENCQVFKTPEEMLENGIIEGRVVKTICDSFVIDTIY